MYVSWKFKLIFSRVLFFLHQFIKSCTYHESLNWFLAESIFLHNFINAHFICFQFLAVYFVHTYFEINEQISLPSHLLFFVFAACQNEWCLGVWIWGLEWWRGQVGLQHRLVRHIAKNSMWSCSYRKNSVHLMWLTAKFVLLGRLKWRFITTDIIDSKVCVAWQAKMTFITTWDEMRHLTAIYIFIEI